MYTCPKQPSARMWMSVWVFPISSWAKSTESFSRRKVGSVTSRGMRSVMPKRTQQSSTK